MSENLLEAWGRGACPTVYGPVTSRRHGLSLGINLGSPLTKSCTWGCVYCQCGFGKRGEPDPASLPGREEVLREVRMGLERHDRLDSVTFAGNSEPTSHPEFPEIVEGICSLREQLGRSFVLNALTNGSELDHPQVVAALDRLDEAWVKLDCAEESLFRRMNRPIARTGGVTEHLARIARLKDPKIQTLLWQGVLSNWTDSNRRALVAAYERLRPAEIHLTTVSRATATRGLVPIGKADLDEFARSIARSGIRVSAFA